MRFIRSWGRAGHLGLVLWEIMASRQSIKRLKKKTKYNSISWKQSVLRQAIHGALAIFSVNTIFLPYAVANPICASDTINENATGCFVSENQNITVNVGATVTSPDPSIGVDPNTLKPIAPFVLSYQDYSTTIGTAVVNQNAGSMNGILTNQGVLLANGLNTSNGDPATVHINKNFLGTINNSGEIRAIQLNNAGLSASSIAVLQIDNAAVATGSVNNTATGVIRSEVEINSALVEAAAEGIKFAAAYSGTINNENKIEAHATNHAFSGNAFAYAIVPGRNNNNFEINNATSGASIPEVVATADASGRAEAYGLLIDGGLQVRIFNEGAIKAQNRAGESGDAAAVFVASSLDGASVIENRVGARLFAEVTGKASVNADNFSATAVAVGGNLGSVTHSSVHSFDNAAGAIVESKVTAYNGSSGAVAAGIQVGGALNSTLSNQGVFDIKATSSGNMDVAAYGIRIDNGVGATGQILNQTTGVDSAKLQVYAINSGAGSATAYGLRVSNGMAGVFNNSGKLDIQATATGNAAQGAFASAVHISGDVNTVSNANTIQAWAYVINDANTVATAMGVRASGDLTGSFNNSGMIDASAAATGTHADVAQAIAVTLNNIQNGAVFSNSGTAGDVKTIKAFATADTQGVAYAMAVRLTGDLAGQLTNGGVVDAKAYGGFTGAYTASATAISVVGDLASTGVLANTGTIAATAKGYGTQAPTSTTLARARGVRVAGLDGQLTNQGSITATADAYGMLGAESAAVRLSGDMTGALLNDAGAKMEAIATAKVGSTASSLNAYAIQIGSKSSLASISTPTAILTNHGTLTATALAEAGGMDADAYGISVYGGVSGIIINSSNASIAANATQNGSGSATAFGMEIRGHLTGTVSNAGSLKATATVNNGSAGAFAEAFNLYLPTGANLIGTLQNSGEITAEAISQGWAGAYTVGVGDVSGNLLNAAAGRITATAHGMSASAYGFESRQLSGVLNNQGTIAAHAIATLSYASAYGVGVNNDISGTLLNSGSITAIAEDVLGQAQQSGMYAYGVYASYVNAAGNIANSGTIAASALLHAGSGEVSANGVDIRVDMMGTLTNTGAGHIIVSAENHSVNGTSVRATGIRVGGQLTGILDNAGEIKVTGKGITNATQNGTFEVNGIQSASALIGTINNSGTITVEGDHSGDNDFFRVRGIGVMGAVGSNAQLLNTGDIVAKATDSHGTSDFAAYGVLVDDDFYGNFVNGAVNNSTSRIKGEAVAEATSLVPNLYAYGVRIGGAGGQLNGVAGSPALLTNYGVIEGVANAKAGSTATAYAQGILIQDGIGQYATLENKAGALVSAQATGQKIAWATGISLYGGHLSGTLNNAGNIRAVSVNYGVSSAGATGIYVDGNVAAGASLVNSGNIVADARNMNAAATQVSAYGMKVGGQLNSTLNNSGSMTIIGNNAGVGGVNAYGIRVDSVGVDGSINSGGMTVAANNTNVAATGDVNAGAIYVVNGGSLDHNMSVNGLVTVTATNAGTGATNASGLNLGDIATTLSTNGFDVTGTNSNANNTHNLTVYAFKAGALSGTFTDTGTIIATASSQSKTDKVSSTALQFDSLAAGSDLNLGGLTATATNSNVTATGDVIALALHVVNGGNLSSNLVNTGVVTVTATNAGLGYTEAQGYSLTNTDIGAGATISMHGFNVTATNNNVNSQDVWAIAFDTDGGSTLRGTFENGGATVVKSENWGVGSAWATGLYFADMDTSGIFNNTGSITVTARNLSANGSRVGVTGLSFGSSGIVGTLNSTGSIVVTANNLGIGDTFATGVWGSGTANNVVFNTITANAIANNTAATGLVSAVAFWAGTLLGNITSNGNITVNAINKGSGDTLASGIVLANIANAAELDLSGTVAVNATTTKELQNVTVRGVAATGTMDGFVNNTGSIHTNVKLAGSGAVSGVDIVGLYLGGDVGASGVIGNTSHQSIRAVLTAPSGSVYAVKFNSAFNGALNNTGTIEAVMNGIGGPGGIGYAVHAASGTGWVNNQAGGIISGSMTLGGTVNLANAGSIVTPLSHNNTVGGVLNVGGQYVQSGDGVIEFGALSDTVYSTMTVTGTAEFAPGSKKIALRIPAINQLSAGSYLDNVISTNTGWNGSLVAGEKLAVVSNAFVTYEAFEDGLLANQNGHINGGNHIDIGILSKKTIGNVLCSNPNLCGIANTLDQLAAGSTGSGPLDPLLDKILNAATASEADQIVSQLTPLLTTGTNAMIGSAMHNLNRTVLSRLDVNRGMNSGDEFFGDDNFWMKPIASVIEQNNRDGVAGYDAKAFGMMVGADKVVSDDLRLGSVFAYSRANVESKSSAKQHATLDDFLLALYGSYYINQETEINFQADVGLNKVNGVRHIPAMGVVARSHYSNNSYHVGAGVGHRMDLNENTNFTASFRADYSRLTDSAYTERDAGAYGLRVKSANVEELIFLTDGKFIHEFSDNMELTANLGVGYDVLAQKTAVTAGFIGEGQDFVVRGMSPTPWLTRGGLGLTTKTEAGLEISARYDFEAREDFLNQAASVKVLKKF